VRDWHSAAESSPDANHWGSSPTSSDDPRQDARPPLLTGWSWTSGGGWVSPRRSHPFADRACHEAGGGFFIQAGGPGGGPEAVAAERSAPPGELLNPVHRGCADVELDGEGTHQVGDCLIEVPERLTQAGQGAVADGGVCLVSQPARRFQELPVEGLGGVVLPRYVSQDAELVMQTDMSAWSPSR